MYSLTTARQILYFLKLLVRVSRSSPVEGMDHTHLECVLNHSHAQYAEDKVLLPLLLRAAGYRPGTFVELGALNGLLWSNTLIFERCFGWRGLLIEASPVNYDQLSRSGRSATAVHSAVCPDGVGSFNMSSGGGGTAGNPAFMFDKRGKKMHGFQQGRVASQSVATS